MIVVFLMKFEVFVYLPPPMNRPPSHLQSKSRSKSPSKNLLPADRLRCRIPKWTVTGNLLGDSKIHSWFSQYRKVSCTDNIDVVMWWSPESCSGSGYGIPDVGLPQRMSTTLVHFLGVLFSISRYAVMLWNLLFPYVACTRCLTRTNPGSLGPGETWRCSAQR